MRFYIRCSQLRWQINLRCSHQTHGHAYKPSGHPEVGVLTSCIASFVILAQFFRAIKTDMKTGLNHIIFKDVVAALADTAYTGLPLRSTGLFDPWHDTVIRDQVVGLLLSKGITDFCGNPGVLNNADSLNAGQKRSGGLCKQQRHFLFKLN